MKDCQPMKLTAKDSLEKSELDNILYELTGTDERNFFSLMRQEINPWAALNEVQQEVWKQQPENYLDFLEKCEDFLQSLDESLSERHMVRDTTKEIHQEPKWDQRYSSRQFRMDVAGIQPTTWAISESNSQSRKEWQKTTEESNKHTRMLIEYGNFSFDITKKFANSLVRVRTQIRKGVPYLGVGAVWVNMNTGQVQCWVNGCDWKRQLRYSESPNISFDKEYAEFQVLSILQHLGDHTLKNPKNYWTPIIHVKRYRDED